jgi:hypothetical protein
MKVYINFALGILIDVSAAAFNAPTIKKDTGGIMMRALQAQEECEDEGTALDLCLGSANVTDYDDIMACTICPLGSAIVTGFDSCSSADIDSFFALVQSCAVDVCHTACREELQAATECVVNGCCPDVVSNDAATGGGLANGVGGFAFISFASIIVYAVGII